MSRNGGRPEPSEKVSSYSVRLELENTLGVSGEKSGRRRGRRGRQTS
jgi:hypothetical protein